MGHFRSKQKANFIEWSNSYPGLDLNLNMESVSLKNGPGLDLNLNIESVSLKNGPGLDLNLDLFIICPHEKH